MTKIIFYDVDTQRDFILKPGKDQGALFVNDAEKLLFNLKKLTDYAKYNGVKIMGSVDRHFDNDSELQKNGGPFPNHCMDGTLGQKKVEATYLDAFFVKNKVDLQNYKTYSDEEIDQFIKSDKALIFEKQSYDVFTNPVAKKILSTIDKAIVYGVATDYCVLAAAKGMLESGTEVWIVIDAIKGVNINSSNEALENLVMGGAKLISTENVLKGKF